MFEVDKNTAIGLAALNDSQYICSPEGRILGHYVPLDGIAYVEDLEPPPMSEEEKQRRLSGKMFTTEEVLARLKSNKNDQS